MFLLTGYEYFLGFLLIAAAVPILAPEGFLERLSFFELSTILFSSEVG